MEKMTVKAIREIDTKNGARYIMSLVAPKSALALADAKGTYNTTVVDGQSRQYRPDVTLFVTSAVAKGVQAALADGKELYLSADKPEAAEIERSEKGQYFIKAETVLSDTKRLNFGFTQKQTFSLEEAASEPVSEEIPDVW